LVPTHLQHHWLAPPVQRLPTLVAARHRVGAFWDE